MMWIEAAFKITEFSPEAFQAARRKFSLRRSDRYTALVLSALDGLLSSYGALPEDTGIIVASSFGPHRTTCAFLDDLLDYAEEDAMPTTFSHSVHNAAASYAASAFGCLGPEFSLTGFENLFGEALGAAKLCEALCSRMLVVSVEEKALMTERALEQSCEVAPEGAAAFLISFAKTERSLSELVLREGSACRSPFELVDAVLTQKERIYFFEVKS